MVKRIGKYELGKTLGCGTFSKVKYGLDTETKEAYAIKIVDRKQVEKEKMEIQLKREIAIMKILKHPNVVSLREVLQTTKHIYIVLELITGGELFDRIVSAKRFDEATARRYFQQLILGIEYCHAQGISHRDLKPENLLLDKNDVLKITDFGLSALSDNRDGGRQKMLMTTCGTPNYVAPEVLLEKGYDGFKTDIWSSGVILFVMLAGYLPFDDPTMNGLFAKIEKGAFKVPRHISEEAKALIHRMLVVDPNARITLAEIKNDPWFRVNLEAVEAISMAAPTNINVNEQMVRAAVADTQETIVDTTVQTSAPTDGMNAFDLASRLMAGGLNPLLSRNTNTNTSNTIRRETRFMANGTAESVMARLVQVLTEENTNPKVKGTEIKGYIAKPTGPFTYVAEIHTTIANSFVMVEFRRGRGDALEYNQFFRTVKEKLVDIISTTKTPTL